MGAHLALGTAQLGSDYGVKKDGQPSPEEIEKILSLARKHIEVVDTAAAYGPMPQFDGFKVVTKTPWGPTDNIYAVLVHTPDNQMWHGTWSGMDWLFKVGRHYGLKVGVSVYTPEQLERFLEYPIEIVQFPLSIVDGRFLSFIPVLRQRGIEIHARSVFLQGALLMENPPVSVPTLDVETCLGYVLAQDIDYAVVGVNSAEQLEEVLSVKPLDIEGLNLDDERVDPRRWD